MDNAVDEALAGYCDQIDIALLDNGGVRVADNGRGIPVKEHPVEKIPTVTLVLTVLHAGGKFGNGGYKVSGGLHGVGSSVVNALSKEFTVEVSRDGHRYVQTFDLGVPRYDLQELEETEDTGTTITFYPSPEIFETTVFNYETLATRFREMAFLNKGLRLTLTDLRTVDREGEDSEEEHRHDSFRFENGLIDYVRYRASHGGHPNGGLPAGLLGAGDPCEVVLTAGNEVDLIGGGARGERQDDAREDQGYAGPRRQPGHYEIGRASCRERV